MTVRIGVGAVVFARCLAIDRHAKLYGFAVGRGAENKMQISCVKPINDLAVVRGERCALAADQPIA